MSCFPPSIPRPRLQCGLQLQNYDNKFVPQNLFLFVIVGFVDLGKEKAMAFRDRTDGKPSPATLHAAHSAEAGNTTLRNATVGEPLVGASRCLWVYSLALRVVYKFIFIGINCGLTGSTGEWKYVKERLPLLGRTWDVRTGCPYPEKPDMLIIASVRERRPVALQCCLFL